MEWEGQLIRMAAGDAAAAAYVQRRISDVLRTTWGRCDPDPYRGRGAELRHEVVLVLFEKTLKARVTGVWPWLPGLEDWFLRGTIGIIQVRERVERAERARERLVPEPEVLQLELESCELEPDASVLNENQRRVYRALLSRHIPITRTDEVLQEVARTLALPLSAVQAYHRSVFTWAAQRMAEFLSELPRTARGRHRDLVLRIHEQVFVKELSSDAAARELGIPVITVKRMRDQIRSAAIDFLIRLLADGNGGRAPR
jgi:hypothetical protein